MAIIFEFPTEKQRARAGIEAVLKRIIVSGGLDEETGKDMLEMVMASYDRYQDWNIQCNIAPPEDQPFTEGQKEAINQGLVNFGNDFMERIKVMFTDILTLKMQLYLSGGA